MESEEVREETRLTCRVAATGRVARGVARTDLELTAVFDTQRVAALLEDPDLTMRLHDEPWAKARPRMVTETAADPGRLVLVREEG